MRADLFLLLRPVCTGEVRISNASFEDDIGPKDQFQSGALHCQKILADVTVKEDLLLLHSFLMSYAQPAQRAQEAQMH